MAAESRPIRKKNIFSLLEELGADKLIGPGIPLKLIPKVLFLVFLGALYINNGHRADNRVRRLSKVRQEVQDLRADYITLKSEYMLKGKYSEVIKKASGLGLYESTQPPYKITLAEEK